MRQIYSGIIKAFLDKLSALIVLIIISPIMLVITLVLYLKHKEVLYRQERPGYKGKSFTILKYSTFDVNEKIDSGIRSFLRKSHLNEAPQLFNILQGDMSWVGPRPLLLSYMPFYTQEQNERHDVKPGIFGLAQLKESEIRSWEEKFKLDLDYVNNQSFALDLKIILLSIKQALTGKLYDRAGSLERFNSE